MLIMIAFLAIAGIFDHLLHRIPNLLTGIMFAVCVIYNLAVSGTASIISVLLRGMVIASFLFVFFSIGVLGAGDVKLFAVCSGFMEPEKYLEFVFISFLVAGVYGTLRMAAKGELVRRWITLKKYICHCLRTGKLSRYHCSKEAEEKAGVPLAGAMLISALLGIGGLY